MTLQDIRADEAITKWAAKTFARPEFRSIMDMLEAGHPMRFIEPSDTQPVTASSAEKKLGKIEGYELCLLRLRSCSSFEPPLQELKTSFEPPEQEEQDAN